jgi:transcriptional antiterminator RfaH
MVTRASPSHPATAPAAEYAALPCRNSTSQLAGQIGPSRFTAAPRHGVRTPAQLSAWYCARTKPKHEHIAAANVRKNLNLEVFLPRLKVERATRRGVVRVVEALFPCYIFVRCALDERLNDIQHTNGISSVVHFGNRIPAVADSVIEELQECFEAEEPMSVEDRLCPGDEVFLAEGAFTGMRAFVLRAMPARQRVQVLLDILGGPTPEEVERKALVRENDTVAGRAPILAAPQLEMLRV